MPLAPLDELAALLRPAGGGLYLVSTGKAEQEELQRRLYGVADNAAIVAAFHASLEKIRGARGVILAVPSDVGAGFQRGANLGPAAIRQELHGDPGFAEFLASRGVVDIGDVFVVPQLLHDDMLNEAQKAATRRAIYPGIREELPVGPLSIEERALDLVLGINPEVKLFVIGGDHSTAWPVSAALGRARPQGSWGIVQPDAHTDLLEERLGVKYCFATWSFHANQLIGGQGRMVQVGIRATRFPREHWETSTGVRQFWAEDCRQHPGETLDAIIAHLKATGVRGVYFSNDIDGTDSEHADATGTPEPAGCDPEFIVELIRRLGREIGLVAGDIMEVAPSLQPRPDSRARTVALAARYFRETIAAALP